MKTLKFKTNINCNGCISSVTPFLNELDGVETWKVDIEDANKILTVESEHVSTEEIIQTVKKVGFKIESLDGNHP